MLTIGPYTISSIPFGTFRLDGGAMFGSVPKTLWSRTIPVDADNCIPLAARGLLIKSEERTILVDTGLGHKWNEKFTKIFNIASTPESALPFKSEEITDLVLTHLHFDHAGGVSKDQDGAIALMYPQATHYLQQKNYDIARNPSSREQASYLKENVEPLQNATLTLLDGTTEIFPGISVHCIDGHTEGQQWIKVSDGKDTLAFPTDLIPTSRHLPLPFVMGYDLCARTSLQEKETFLNQALEENWIVAYQHDPDVIASTITRNEKGHFAVKDIVDL